MGCPQKMDSPFYLLVPSLYTKQIWICTLLTRRFLCGIIPCASRPTSSMVEQLTLNQLVQGSSPWSVTHKHPSIEGCLFYILQNPDLLITTHSISSQFDPLLSSQNRPMEYYFVANHPAHAKKLVRRSFRFHR